MEFWKDIREFGCTTAAAPGTVGRWLVQQPEDPRDADNPLRNVVMAPLDPAVDDFRRRFGVRVCTAFGMTEVSIPFSSNGWDTPPNTQSCGRPREGYPGYDVRLVDEHDLPVALGETGELVVRTSVPWTLNSGYFGMPDKTAEAWRNGWFHTGDAFRVDEDGWYYFVDRIKDCIRRRGENISSFEVEAGVNEHPAVLECAAVAVPADDAEDEVKVFVVRKPDQELTPEELVTFLVPRMPRFMIPRYIQFVDALPKTEASQRVQKNLLRQDAFNDDTWDRQAARMNLPK
jgi:crotonobetaine/carnitine-CoA ligase